MNNNTVLLCYDDKEKALAEELKERIDELFDKKINIKLCCDSSDSKDKSVWKERLEEAFKSDKALIFVLCSPFSIGQSWVNFISGAVTIKIENTSEKKRPKIIPICHSGKKSKDLPHYLLSRQALDIQHDSFLDGLISTLAKELSIKESILQGYDLHLMSVATTDILPNDGRNLVIVALVGSDLHIRIFDASGNKVVDKAEKELVSGETLNSLKQRFDVNAVPHVSGLSKKDKQKIIIDAISIALLLQRLRNISYGENRRHKTLSRRYTVLQRLRNINNKSQLTLHRKGETITITSTSSQGKTNSFCSEEARLELIGKMHKLLECRDNKTPTSTSSQGKTNSFCNEEARLELIGKMRKLLKCRDNKTPLIEEVNEVNAVVAMGVQNCLYDETSKSFYVGLMRQLEVDSTFKSYCSPRGIFKPGYEILAQHIPAGKTNIMDLFVTGKSYKKEDVEISPSPTLYKLIKQRAEAMGHTLWNIEFHDKQIGIATIFINRSGPVPRFEIGVWKFINITSLKDQDIVPDFGGGISEQQNSYWIWVRNGEIYYWSFPDEELIPRYKGNACLSGKLVLVKTEYLIKTYGRPEKFTPFAPDDALGVENVVKDRFSAAAGELLSCF